MSNNFININSNYFSYPILSRNFIPNNINDINHFNENKFNNLSLKNSLYFINYPIILPYNKDMNTNLNKLCENNGILFLPYLNPNSESLNLTVEYKNRNNGRNLLKTYILDNKGQSQQKEENNKISIPENKIKPENIINIESILSGKEKRTFLRLHPIPKTLSVYDIIKIIDKNLKTIPGKRIYNAIYVPQTKTIGKNLGYCFINLIKPKYVIEFHKIFNGFYFHYKNFKKPCHVIFSTNQEVDTSNKDPTRRQIIFNDTIRDEIDN